MKSSSITAACLIFSLACHANGQGADDALKKRFLLEYPQACNAWRDHWTTMVGTIRFAQDNPKSNGQSHSEGHYTFKVKLPDMATLAVTPSEVGQPAQFARVAAYNKEYSFRLKKATDRNNFSLQSLEAVQAAPPRAEYSPVNGSLIPMLQPILLAPFRTIHPNVVMVTSPRFVVKKISPLVRSGKSLLRIEFDWPNNPKFTPPKKGRATGNIDGYMIVSPEEKWVLYEFECRVKSGEGHLLHKGTIEYEGSVAGFPCPKLVSGQQIKLPGGEVLSSSSWEFQELHLADIPDKAFTLSSFGISEDVVHGPKARRNPHLGHWLLGLAIAALVAAVLFKIVSLRIDRRPASS